ncbi:CAAX prenyl protease [Rhizophlyctis rosea]|nr:CAAX prenyl protease [Rhizophlyctis rosea]
MASFTLQSLGLIGFSQLAPKLQIPIALSSSTTTNPTSSSTFPPTNVQSPPPPESPSRLQTRCPIDFKPADIPTDGIYSLQRVSRHPTLFSLGFLGLGAALGTPFIAESIMFGFPIVFALIGGAHQDYRFRKVGELTAEKDDKTSLVPFGALVSGKQDWRKLAGEMKWVNAAVAVVVAVGLHFRRGARLQALAKMSPINTRP